MQCNDENISQSKKCIFYGSINFPGFYDKWRDAFSIKPEKIVNWLVLLHPVRSAVFSVFASKSMSSILGASNEIKVLEGISIRSANYS
jgi:hypothetical protein